MKLKRLGWACGLNVHHGCKEHCSNSQQRNTELVLASRDYGTSKYKGIIVPMYARKAYGWKRGTVPFIPILGTRCSKVAHSMPWPLYPQGCGSKYPPNMSLNGQQASLDILEKRQNLLLCQESSDSLVSQRTDVAMSKPRHLGSHHDTGRLRTCMPHKSFAKCLICRRLLLLFLLLIFLKH